jgi:serine/threonine-protein kinase
MASSASEVLAFQVPDPFRLPVAGTLVASRYELGELLGEGGMSAVFSAYDWHLRRSVAFKLLSPRLAHAHDIVARFVNEARTLARLDSANVVEVFDVGVTGEPGGIQLPFMVLELMKGELLRTLTETLAYDDERVVAWMLDACEGLAAAHAEGIIHRDLKPENLFVVAEPDGSEHVKILDFGIARSLQGDSTLTLAGEGVGSPGYMSPEQLRDASSVDARSDVWSLGVVMYELFARELPFDAQSPLELCSNILNAPIPPLGELRPDLDPELAAIVDRCLERDRDRRWADVLELAEALSRFARPSRQLATARIRRRLSRGRAALDGGVDLDVDIDVDADPNDALDRPAPSGDVSETRLISSGVRARRLVRRMWFARALGFLLLSGVLALLFAALVPSARARTQAFSTTAAAKIQETARGFFNPR